MDEVIVTLRDDKGTIKCERVAPSPDPETDQLPQQSAWSHFHPVDQDATKLRQVTVSVCDYNKI